MSLKSAWLEIHIKKKGECEIQNCEWREAKDWNDTARPEIVRDGRHFHVELGDWNAALRDPWSEHGRRIDDARSADHQAQIAAVQLLIWDDSASTDTELFETAVNVLWNIVREKFKAGN